MMATNAEKSNLVSLDILPDVTDFKLSFCLMKIGPDSNATRSKFFGDAECDLRSFRIQGALCAAHFTDIFTRGFELLSDLKSKKISFNDIPRNEQSAITILNNFLTELRRGQHVECLKKIKKIPGRTKEKISETKVAVVLAEHLLCRLSPGQAYILDARSKQKESSGCHGAEIHFGETGIGHELVWHGFLDIVLQSPVCGNIPDTTVTTVSEELITTPKKRMRIEENIDSEEEASSSPGGKCISEEKISLYSNNVENQSVSQAIVFSLLQQSRHPELKHFLIPNIVISASHFRVIMYDAKNDVLLRSQLLPLSLDDSIDDDGGVENENILSPVAIVYLWMVLHYKIFCSGIDIDALEQNLDDIKAGFPDVASSRWDIYSHSLKSGVGSFPLVKKDGVPSEDSYMLTKSIFKRKQNQEECFATKKHLDGDAMT